MRLIGAGLLLLAYTGFNASEESIRHVNHQWRKREVAEIGCVESKLITNPATKATSIKILTDNGDTLFSVDSTNTEIRDLGLFFVVLFLSELEDKLRNNSDFVITKQPSANGINVTIVNKPNNTVFEKEIQGSNEGLKGLDVKCARLTGYKVILDPTLDVSHRDSYNMTPLLWAGLFGDEETAKKLVERDAKVNSDKRNVDLVVVSTILAGKDVLLEYLIKGGAEVKASFPNGKTPLHIAARKGQINCARVLLNHGANISSKLRDGATPLLYAASEGQIEMVKELVARGADIHDKTKQGMTGVHIAVAIGNEDLIHYFAQSGVNVNSKDNGGATPLIMAIKYDQNENECLKIVKHLIEHHNADVNIKDNNGNTALSWATKNGFNRVQDYLKAHGAI